MPDITERSLGELRELYRREIQEWTQRRDEHEKQAAQCRREIEAREAKLRHVEALIGGPAAPEPAAAPRRRLARRRRVSPVKAATLLALERRSGERLNTRQLLDAIRDDLGKRVSRQSVNVNLALLEQEGRVRKEPAPAGSGARFVYSVIEQRQSPPLRRRKEVVRNE